MTAFYPQDPREQTEPFTAAAATDNATRPSSRQGAPGVAAEQARPEAGGHFADDADEQPRLEARRDLAAAHRLAVWHDFSEGIYNHFTLAVPGTNDRFLLPPFGLHWSEIQASQLMTIGFDGKLLAGEGIIQRSAYCIHAPIHAAHAKHQAVFHTHMPYAGALTRLESQHLLALGQTEALLLDQIAYDDAYDGLARDPAEGERLATILGEKTILFMGNHGVLVTGRSAAEAYDRLYTLERAARVQLFALWTGQRLRGLSPAQVDKVQDQIHNTPLHNSPGEQYKPGYQLHFEALRRLLDRREPDYRD
ncbi:class II aldolase/adducin family protein [Sodalis ligni]|uniref:Ribulose-5-phosphate 4-epimerase/fuculose-1-phosphate aldolase n=1 Tax=Sodalis ligni TaxID=2697027 RepID=A0A4R1NHD4_9GAMM|nr:class II aldolase/adducin family protein [Sodalis ligni]TCL05231.1 ribulose-5-phosphate 4-epimerase/fuculose-1-phosphate aldolase [Sodalis ligni]